MTVRTFRFEIFLVSLAAILLEISYTRVFSFKLFYYFTYLTIGIVLLGLGAGAVFVALSARLRSLSPERAIPLFCLIAALMVPVGYVVVALTQLNAIDLASDPLEFVKLAIICTVLFLPFLCVGIVLATIFGAFPAKIGRLYFADLMGAGLGCALVVPLFNLVGPPGCIVLAGALFASASLPLYRGDRRFWVGVTLALGLLVATVTPGLLPDPVPDRVKTMSPQRSGDGVNLFSRWSAVFRVDVVDAGWEGRYLINHDGNLGSNLIQFDGDLESPELDRFDVDVRSTPFSVVKKNPRVLVIGAAGGHEILASLYFGAEHVTAVELNPVTTSLLQEHFADYTGRLAENDRVTLVNAEGRSFIKRDQQKYDLIWFVAPDTYAAMNAASSGAFVLSESYLYTTEMIRESLDHLNEGGKICLQTGDIAFHQKPNRATRYLMTAREAFRSLGIDDFSDHVLVSSTPEFFTMVTILLKGEPFNSAEVARFRANAAVVRPVGEDSTVWHAGPDGAGDGGGGRHPVNQVISLGADELAAWRESYPYDVSPVTDDSPFFWHFTRFRDAVSGPTGADDTILDPEDAIGERVLMVLLAFTVLFAAVFLLLPLVAMRDVWRKIPYKANAAIYFAALGLGFMFFEICLIQKLTLFLGYPTYSLTVTLFALLIFSGIGSLLTERYARPRNRALGLLLAAVATLTVIYLLGLGPLVDGLVGLPLPLRAGIAIAFLAPLGLCLGAFMPIGLTTIAGVTSYKQEFVAWGWAVNGFCSVVSSVLATILSMTFGFRVVLVLALVVYAVGAAALSRLPELRSDAPA